MFLVQSLRYQQNLTVIESYNVFGINRGFTLRHCHKRLVE